MSSANRSDREWLPAPAVPTPPADSEVIVWRISLDAVAADDESGLSAEERERAARLKFPHVQRAFVQGRLFLRRVLAWTLGCSADELCFASEGNGKPVLVGRPLAFNLSHSSGMAVLAVASAGPVGVDVEVVRPDRDLIGMARRYFATSEFNVLSSLPVSEQAAAFYRCWTRKEAFIKALGEGLSHPLDSFSVSFAPGAPAEFTSLQERGDGWRIFNLDLGHAFAGAVVVPGEVKRLTCFMLHAI